MRPFARVSMCLCLAAITACASGGGGGRSGGSSSGSPFPTRSQIDTLTHGSGAANPYAQAVVDAETWTFTEPAALQLVDEPYVEASFWGELLRRRLKDAPQLTATRNMHCAAREFARFYLEYAATPATPLRNAIMERCGAIAVEAMPSFVFGPVTRGVTDESLQNQWRTPTQQLMTDYGGAGPRSVGIAFARDDKKAVVVFLSGTRRAQIEPMSRAVDADGSVVIAGRSLVSALTVSALVNQGRHGYARCDADETVKLPDFRLTCAIAPGDSSARIMVSAFEPGRILGKTLATVEAVRGASPGQYRRFEYAGDAPVRDVAELPERLLEVVNDVREQAGVSRVALSAAETATAAKLAPRYFEAFTAPSGQEAADVIMLGLLAGWDVEREGIRSAGFTAGVAGPTRNAGDWLSSVMSDPSGRAVLMDPSARVIALGPLMTESPATIAATYTSYSFFEANDDQEVKREFLERIRSARAAKGLSAPVLVTTLDADMAALASELREGRSTTNATLSALAQTGVEVLGRPVQCVILEGTSVELLPFPDELLEARSLELALTVTHHRPQDSPWGQFLVLVLVPGEGPRA